MTTVTRIEATDAPPASGHYSHATAYGNLVFVSGQLPAGPDGNEGDRQFEAQVRQALGNLFAVLRSAGCGPEHVLKVTVFLVGVERWPAFNRVYGKIFGEIRPARSVVPVPHLHDGYLVEIEAIAVRPDSYRDEAAKVKTEQENGENCSNPRCD